MIRKSVLRQNLAPDGDSTRYHRAPGRAADTIMPVPALNRPTVGQLAKAHTFRFVTMIATWLLIFAAFVYHPEWIKDWLRFMTHSIEALADMVPEPWGSRFEVMLKEIGGVIWIQIASAIVLLRLLIWVPFHVWRLRREHRRRYLERRHLERRNLE
jgi:threonine/homoserine/homoserine lactone efflux protein